MCFACWSEIDYKGNRASAISKLLLLLEHVKGLWLVKSRLLTVPLLIVERAREIAVRNSPRSNLAASALDSSCMLAAISRALSTIQKGTASSLGRVHRLKKFLSRIDPLPVTAY